MPRYLRKRMMLCVFLWLALASSHRLESWVGAHGGVPREHGLGSARVHLDAKMLCPPMEYSCGPGKLVELPEGGGGAPRTGHPGPGPGPRGPGPRGLDFFTSGGGIAF